MNRGQQRKVVWIPLAIWAGLLVLAAANLGYAFVPHAPAKLAVQLALAAANAIVVALLFMQLRRGAGIVRIAAGAGLAWGSFLYLLTFADVLTR